MAIEDEEWTKKLQGRFWTIRARLFIVHIILYSSSSSNTEQRMKPLSASNNLFIEHNFSSDNYCLVIIIIKITTEWNEREKHEKRNKRTNGREREMKKIKSYIFYTESFWLYFSLLDSIFFNVIFCTIIFQYFSFILASRFVLSISFLFRQCINGFFINAIKHSMIKIIFHAAHVMCVCVRGLCEQRREKMILLDESLKKMKNPTEVKTQKLTLVIEIDLILRWFNFILYGRLEWIFFIPTYYRPCSNPHHFSHNRKTLRQKKYRKKRKQTKKKTKKHLGLKLQFWTENWLLTKNFQHIFDNGSALNTRT